MRATLASATALATDPTSLLMRNPADPEGLWSVWDRTKPGERQKIVEIAETLLRRARQDMAGVLTTVAGVVPRLDVDVAVVRLAADKPHRLAASWTGGTARRRTG